MTRPVLKTLLIVLALIGLSDSWYLTAMAYSGKPLVCNIAGLDGCNTVAQSAYSYLFGLPLALYGVIFYVLVFVLVASLFFIPKRQLYRTLHAIGAVGLIASIIFELIQIFLIKALCVYCLLSAVLSAVIFVLAWQLWKRFAPPKLAVVG
jgi:uncharacterized membrane protein